MREVIQNCNQYDGYDFRYRLKCDNCGEHIWTHSRGTDRLPREFLTCGEDELCAMQYGWYIDNERHICPKCKEALVGKGLMP